MASDQAKYKMLIMRFMDFIIGRGIYYVTEKPITHDNDRRIRGYREQEERVPVEKLHAFHWMVLLTQVSKGEIERYVEDWALEFEQNNSGVVEMEYSDILMKYTDVFIEDYLVFDGADTKIKGELLTGYGHSKKSGRGVYSSARVKIRKPSREELVNQVSFFLTDENRK